MKNINIEKVKTAVIIVLSLIIVFGLAFVIPELKNCGSCKEEQKTLTKITMKDYRELLNGEEVSLVYIASPTCGYCAQQEPIMIKFVNKYGIEVNYLDVSNITNDESLEVYKSYGKMQEDLYKTEGLRTPTIILVQKGKTLDMNLGSMPLEDLEKLVGKYIELVEE